MSFLTVVQMEYAVTLECKDCVDSVSTALSKIPGINNFKVSLEDQSVFVEGTVARGARRRDGTSDAIPQTAVAVPTPSLVDAYRECPNWAVLLARHRRF